MLSITKVLKVAYWKTTSTDSSSRTIAGLLNDLADYYESVAEETVDPTPRSKTIAGALKRAFGVTDEDIADYNEFMESDRISD